MTVQYKLSRDSPHANLGFVNSIWKNLKLKVKGPKDGNH